MHEARFYEPLSDKKVLCTLCPHDCRIPNGGRGACSVRYNRDGRLFTLVYDKVVAREVNPIEKKPLFHFHPGSYAYSISTVGCNLRCSYCQNWQISQCRTPDMERLTTCNRRNKLQGLDISVRDSGGRILRRKTHNCAGRVRLPRPVDGRIVALNISRCQEFCNVRSTPP